MKTNVMGLEIDNITMKDAVALSEKALSDEVGQLAVFTPNAEIAYACLKDETLMKTVNSAEMILPDGIGVIKAAKILGTPIKEKTAGVEYGEKLCEKCAGYGAGLYILGGKPGVAETAAANLKSKYGGLVVSGTHDGYFNKTGAENEAVVKEIADSGARVLFVCLGFPAQEIWAKENRDKLPGVKIIACLGGSVDVYAGTAKRAPKLFIKLKLEWLYRLIKEPSRYKRMSVIPKYLREVKKYKKERKEL